MGRCNESQLVCEIQSVTSIFLSLAKSAPVPQPFLFQIPASKIIGLHSSRIVFLGSPKHESCLVTAALVCGAHSWRTTMSSYCQAYTVTLQYARGAWCMWCGHVQRIIVADDGRHTLQTTRGWLRRLRQRSTQRPTFGFRFLAITRIWRHKVLLNHLFRTIPMSPWAYLLLSQCELRTCLCFISSIVNYA